MHSGFSDSLSLSLIFLCHHFWKVTFRYMFVAPPLCMKGRTGLQYQSDHQSSHEIRLIGHDLYSQQQLRWLPQCIHWLHGYNSNMGNIVSTWAFNGPVSQFDEKTPFHLTTNWVGDCVWRLHLKYSSHLKIPVFIHLWWLNQIPCWLFKSQ